MFMMLDHFDVGISYSCQRTSLHKGVLVVPEYFNNILVTDSHIKGTCNGGEFELNGLLVL